MTKENRQRYCLRKDDDGHDYLIPAEKSDLFRDLAGDSDNWEKFEQEFGDLRMGCSYELLTFTNPKLEQ